MRVCIVSAAAKAWLELLEHARMTFPRLYTPQPLAGTATIELGAAQAERLLRVLRLQAGARVRVFNGSDGEFEGVLSPASRRAHLEALRQVRAQTTPPPVGLLFAPLKRTATDWLVEKAVELGAAWLQPVMTRRTVAERVRLDRLALIAQSAAEQCERMELPRLAAPCALEKAVAAVQAQGGLVVFADEAGGDPREPWGGPHGKAAPIAQALAGARGASLSLLIGPEGGFDPAERAWLRAQPHVRSVSLGPRALRAEPAALAGLAIIQSLAGDWAESLAGGRAGVHMQPDTTGDAND